MKETEFGKTVDSTMLSGRLKGIDMFLQKSAQINICSYTYTLISKRLKRT